MYVSLQVMCVESGVVAVLYLGDNIYIVDLCILCNCFTIVLKFNSDSFTFIYEGERETMSEDALALW